MEAGFVLLAVALVFVSFIIGLYTGKYLRKNKESQGILNIDLSDPANGPYLYLELSTSVADVADRKQSSFDVRIIK